MLQVQKIIKISDFISAIKIPFGQILGGQISGPLSVGRASNRRANVLKKKNLLRIEIILHNMFGSNISD